MYHLMHTLAAASPTQTLLSLPAHTPRPSL